MHMRLDAHQHFWHFNALRDQWITEEMGVLRADFTPQMLAPLLKEEGVEGCIAVQADSSEEETRFLLDLAERYPFIKGVVGWVDLCSEDLRGQLIHYQKFSKLKGFRHILQAETDPHFMLKPAFLRGLRLLEEFNFVYDLLVLPGQLPNTLELVKKMPGLNMVIDHLAKPFIKQGEIEPWASHMRALAQYPSIYCKVSGMVTEADLLHWKDGDFKPYMDVVFDAFGTERLMFGSDWPVCLLASSYKGVCELVEEYMSDYSDAEKHLFWKGNAERFYKLEKS